MKLNLADVFGERKGLAEAAEEITELTSEYEKIFGERLKFNPFGHRTKQAYMQDMRNRIEEYKSAESEPAVMAAIA